MKTATPLRRDVFILLQSFRSGGAERVLAQLAAQLCDEIPVRVFVVKNVGPLANDIPASVEIVDLGGRFGWLPRLLRHLWRLRPSSLLTSTWDLNLALLLLRRLIPRETRLIVRESTDPNADEREKPLRRLLRHFYLRRCRHADELVVLRESLVSRFEAAGQVSRDKIHVIPNAPLPERCGDPRTARSSRQDDSAIRLLAVGRLSWEKGFDVLLEAMAATMADHPGLTLTIAGDGPELVNLRNLASALHLGDRVIFAGYEDNPRHHYEESDLFVLSSHHEGLSNAMTEALCSGLPVVATNENTNADEFITDGVSGILVPSCTVEHLHHGLERAIQLLAQFDRQAIAERARHTFSLESWRKAYLDVLSP